jgi:hypothetical protein
MITSSMCVILPLVYISYVLQNVVISCSYVSPERSDFREYPRSGERGYLKNIVGKPSLLSRIWIEYQECFRMERQN